MPFFLQYFFFSELYSSQVLFKIIYWVVFYFSMGRRTEVRDGLNKACFRGSVKELPTAKILASI